MNLKGLGVALVTPFTSEGEIDFDAIPRIIKNIISGGADYLVVLGTTAEVSCLSSLEKKEVIAAVIKANNRNLPLVIGIGGNNTAAVIEEIIQTDLSPFQAILSVSPYYNKPTQEGIYQHYAHLAQVSPIPLIVYNVPSRTGAAVFSKTFLRLANDYDNIIAIKEASGDLAQAEEILKDCPSHVQVISGDDALTLPMLISGAVGTISVLGNALPIPIKRMFYYVEQGELEKAYKMHYQLLDIIQLLFEEGNPVGIKALMKSLSLCNQSVRLPLVQASKGLSNRIESVLEATLLQHNS
jgi:4-hydroxy-tetrahydrodipicolinate synthase